MTPQENTFHEKKKSKAILVELFIIIVFGIVVNAVSRQHDLLEILVSFSHQHEDLELDELLPLAVYLVFALSFFSLRRWQDVRKSAELLSENNDRLRKALDKIKRLQGILPICASCKNIRDDKGYWHEVETYICEHSIAEFSHSICPRCLRKLYPEFAEEE